MISTKLLAFANLLETAHLCALGNTHEKQEELVAFCRAEGRAFLASMPVRHRFRRALCGIETGEVELHFEDPKQPIEGAAPHGVCGQPVGRHFATDFSVLHAMLEHSKELPEEFAALLAGVGR
ncbi:MAG: hypothetical protein JF607_11500 [Burkholderiales bacterium]|jgi:hypothetical protein|nr:hypothetical protein [Burkholderiales bacterium]